MDGPKAYSSQHNDAENSLSVQERLAFLESRFASTSSTATYVPHSLRIANPGPLGLFAFAYTTALLSTTYTKWADGGTTDYAIAYGLFYGGLAQLLAGMWAIWARNTFAGTAFSSFGSFWLGYGTHGILVAAGVLKGMEPEGEQTLLALWAILAFILFLQTFNINIVLVVLFLFLVLQLALMAAGPQHPRAVKAGGYFGQGAASMAFYAGLAELTNEVYRRTIFPLGILNLVTAQQKSNDQRPDTL
ncbi:hypothetical protein WJX73_006009 [Symbiochloris irregularis]|uniref:GPR1/FUN34/yaaH family-domain-containing protein n=1 Tax=Symbiochloris irregularis TaxID=706552 RepID=A0AAW1NMD6_9CHLO